MLLYNMCSTVCIIVDILSLTVLCKNRGNSTIICPPGHNHTLHTKPQPSNDQ